MVWKDAMASSVDRDTIITSSVASIKRSGHLRKKHSWSNYTLCTVTVGLLSLNLSPEGTFFSI